MITAALLAAAIATADAPEPIHRDEPAQPVIDVTPALNPRPGYQYTLAHQEIRHVEPRDKATCMQLTQGVVNEDFMKCRNGYDYKAWVPAHWDRTP